jgi:hypothetical protein
MSYEGLLVEKMESTNRNSRLKLFQYETQNRAREWLSGCMLGGYGRVAVG